MEPRAAEKVEGMVSLNVYGGDGEGGAAVAEAPAVYYPAPEEDAAAEPEA